MFLRWIIFLATRGHYLRDWILLKITQKGEKFSSKLSET